MTTSTTHPVTPQGVRDGDPASLLGLAQRRSGSVHDYALQVCGESGAMDTTAEAFARFRAAVVAADDPAGLAPDTLLLSCTRHASASMTPVSSSRPECPATPFLLVGRLEGGHPVADEARLTRHLATCAACTELAAAYGRAEQAFRAPHAAAPGGVVVARVMAALQAAAPSLHPPGDDELLADAEPHVPAAPERHPEVQDAPATVPGAPSELDVRPPGEPAPPDDDPYELEGFDDTYEYDGDEFLVEDRADTDGDPVPQDGPVQDDPDHVPRVLVPTAIVTTAVLVSMGIAGIFGGTSPAPARGQSDLPSPRPPARPPAADEELQERTAQEARAALRRIEARERRTTRAAQAERDAQLRTTTTPQDGPATAPTAPEGDGTTSAAPDPSPTPRPSAPEDTADSDSSLETVDPDAGDATDTPDSSVFQPGQP